MGLGSAVNDFFRFEYLCYKMERFTLASQKEVDFLLICCCNFSFVGLCPTIVVVSSRPTAFPDVGRNINFIIRATGRRDAMVL